MQEHSIDAFDQLGLFRVHHEVVVRPHVVAQKPLERDCDLAVCKPLPLAPCAVLGNGSGLLLCQRGHNREQQLALAIEGPDVFFLKIALHVVFLQGANGGKAINRVSGKAADRLRNDQVDLSGEGILKMVSLNPGIQCFAIAESMNEKKEDVLELLLELRQLDRLVTVMPDRDAPEDDFKAHWYRK